VLRRNVLLSRIENDVHGVHSALLPYDRHVGRYSPALATALLHVARVGQPARVLDVGCGSGALARALAARLGAERVVAVDSSQVAVEACARAVPGATVRLGSVERLPFADDEFDAVLAQLVIDKVEAPTAAREMRRVATPGAAIAACVWDFESGMALLRAYWDAALAVDPAGARAVGAGDRPPYTRPHELEELWSGTGLDEVEVGELVVGADYDDFEDAWWSFAAGAGTSGAFCGSLDESTRLSLKEEFDRRLGCRRGPFRLSARAWYVRGLAPR
jgi:SAM-dependent methyltransferase